MLLMADIPAVLRRLRRLLPSYDPIKFLLSNPRVRAPSIVQKVLELGKQRWGRKGPVGYVLPRSSS
jgi:hypothetical protein